MDRCKDRKKPCEKDKICNPESGRCVFKNGIIGKKILAMQAAEKVLSPPKKITAKRLQSGAPLQSPPKNIGKEVQLIPKAVYELPPKLPQKKVKFVNMDCKLKPINNCNFTDCILNVKGLASSSYSASDIWILTFKRNTPILNSLGENVYINEAVLKLFINPETWKAASEKYSSKEEIAINMQDLEGLQYEFNVYTKIIKPLLDDDICPHFVRIYTYSSKCTFEDLKTIYDNEDRLKRNIYYMFYFKKDRPAITDNSDVVLNEEKQARIPYEDLRYSFMITQYTENSVSLEELFWGNIEEKEEGLIKKSKSVDPDVSRKAMIDILVILFQCAYACYTLFLSRTIHNDLHCGNVLVSKRDVSKNIKYIVGFNDYTFKDVSYCARIFDFDRAYAEKLNDNPMLGKLCDDFGECNEVLESKDFIRLLWSLYDENFVELYSTIPNREFWINFTKEDKFQKLDRRDWAKALSYPQILNRIYSKYLDLTVYHDKGWCNKKCHMLNICDPDTGECILRYSEKSVKLQLAFKNSIEIDETFSCNKLLQRA